MVLLELKVLVSLFGALKFGERDLFPGGSFGCVEDEGPSPTGGDEEVMDMGESSG